VTADARERTLTIGEHLEELRAHVLRGGLGVLVALVFSLIFQDQLMTLVVAPHQKAAEHIAAQRIAEQAATERSDEERLRRMADALAELERARADIRERSAAGWSDAERADLARAYYAAWGGLQELLPAPLPPHRLVFLRYQDAFLGYLKLCMIAAILLAFPYILFELWRFIAEGLRPEEQVHVRVFGPMSLVCFLIGVSFGWFILLPITLSYLLGYGSPELFQSGITMDSYLGLIFWLHIGVGVIFELPLAIVFGSLVGFVTTTRLRIWRQYFVVIAFVIAAVITPTGDPVTLTIVAVPILGLYEVGFLAVRYIERRRRAHMHFEETS
jgi:sec-independent protein translocase protein TatC